MCPSYLDDLRKLGNCSKNCKCSLLAVGDQMCKAVQSQLAFPVAGNHESIEDLIAACPFDTQTNCCTCWVGLNKQEDGKTWFDSDGNEVKNVEELPWATGQPTDTTGYDCAYIRDAYLFNKNCQGSLEIWYVYMVNDY